MTLIRNLTLGAFASALLAACVQDPRQYETAPWEVPVTQGVVTCQLYTQEFVLWDRALDWPEDISLTQADNICLEEGRKWQRGEIEKSNSILRP